MKRVNVKVEVGLTVIIDDDVTISEVIDELDYDFSDTTKKATIESMGIEDFEIIDIC